MATNNNENKTKNSSVPKVASGQSSIPKVSSEGSVPKVAKDQSGIPKVSSEGSVPKVAKDQSGTTPKATKKDTGSPKATSKSTSKDNNTSKKNNDVNPYKHTEELKNTLRSAQSKNTNGNSSNSTDSTRNTSSSSDTRSTNKSGNTHSSHSKYNTGYTSNTSYNHSSRASSATKVDIGYAFRKFFRKVGKFFSNIFEAIADANISFWLVTCLIVTFLFALAVVITINLAAYGNFACSAFWTPLFGNSLHVNDSSILALPIVSPLFLVAILLAVVGVCVKGDKLSYDWQTKNIVISFAVIILLFLTALGVTIAPPIIKKTSGGVGDYYIAENYMLKMQEYGEDYSVQYCILKNDNKNIDIVIPEQFKGKNVVRVENLVMSEDIAANDGRFLEASEKARGLVKSIVFPNTIKKISNFDFSDYINLSYNQYDSGQYLGSSDNPYMVFVKMLDTDITSILLNKNVKIIDNNAFSICSKLTYNDFGSAMYLGCEDNQHFYLSALRNNQIENLYVLSSTEIINSKAFANCNKLLYINVDLQNSKFYSENNCLISTIDKTLIIGSNNCVIPDGVAKIGDYAFKSRVVTTSLTIPVSVKSIGDYAFSYCRDLSSINFADGLVTIGDNAFDNCVNLISFKTTSNLKSIGKQAFASCSSMKSFAIPKNVKSIGEFAFAGCYDLIGLAVDSDNKYFEGENGWLLEKSKKHLLFCAGVEMPSGCKSIADYAFAGNSKIKSLKLNNINDIGKGAFLGCVSIEYIELPFGLKMKELPEFVFMNCKSLKSIRFSKYIKEIGSCAFAGCSSLNNVSLPQKLEKIGEWAFNDCYSLENLYYNSDKLVEIGDFAFKNSGLKEVLITDNVEIVGKDAFAGCAKVTKVTIGNKLSSLDGIPLKDFQNLNSVILGESITQIPSRMFEGKSNLVTVQFNGNVTSIGDYAFLNCKSLTGFVIPDSVTELGTGIFSGCTSLIRVTIGNGIESIDNEMFSNLSALETVNIGENVKSIGEKAFSNCTSLLNIVIPDSVTSIGYRAFEYCSQLKSIVFGKGLTAIENEIFAGCNNLMTLSLGDNITSIPGNFFSGCRNITTLTLGNGFTELTPQMFIECNRLVNLVIGNSIKIIPNNMFEGSNLVTVKLGSGIESIGERAFANSDSLISVAVSSNLKSIGRQAFYNCDHMRTAPLVNGIVSIGEAAFSGCSAIGSVVLPESLTSLGNNAFYNCYSIESVLISSQKLNTIGSSAFENCTKLSTIVIPQTVTTIGVNAFSKCNLSFITISNGLKKINSNAFYSSTTNERTINFLGTKAEWLAIEKDESWINKSQNIIIYCIDGNVDVYGNDVK